MKKQLITLLTITAAASLLALVLQKTLPLFFAVFFFVLVSLRLPKTLHSIVSVRLFVALIAMMVFIQMQAMFFWVIDVTVSEPVYALVSLLFSLVFAVYTVMRQGGLQPVPKPRLIDGAIILPAIILTGVLAARVALPRESKDVSIVKAVTYGMDDATHISLFNDVIRSDENVLSGTDRYKDMALPSHLSYPVGWHVATTVLASSVMDLQGKPLIDVVRTYFIVKLLSFAGAIMSLSVLCVLLLEKFKLKVNSLSYLHVILIPLAVGFLLVLPSYFEGFFSFLPVVTYTLLFASLILADAKKDKYPHYTTLVLLTLLACGSATTWILTAPLLIAASLLYYREEYQGFRKIPLVFYAVMALGVAYTSIQVYILLYTKSATIDALSIEGGITSPNDITLFGLIVIVFLAYVGNKQLREPMQRLLHLFIPALALLGMVMLYLSLQSDTLTYYYQKFQIVALLLLMPVVLMYAFSFIQERLGPKQLVYPIAAFYLVLLLAVPGIIGFSYFSNIVSRVKNTAILDNTAQALVDGPLSHTFSPSSERTYILDTKSGPTTILGSNIARTPHLSTRCDYTMFSSAYTLDIQAFSKAAKKCFNELPKVVVYTTKNDAKTLHESIAKSYFTKHEIEIRLLQ